MAAVYVFSEALNAQTVGAVHRLGPGYKVRFMIHDNTPSLKFIKKNCLFWFTSLCYLYNWYVVPHYVYVKLQNEIQVKMTSTHKILCLLTLIIIHDPAMHNKDWETKGIDFNQGWNHFKLNFILIYNIIMYWDSRVTLIGRSMLLVNWPFLCKMLLCTCWQSMT